MQSTVGMDGLRNELRLFLIYMIFQLEFSSMYVFVSIFSSFDKGRFAINNKKRYQPSLL